MAVATVGGRLGRYGKFKHKKGEWRVGDADVGLTFQVTAKHIANGVPRVAFECAGALAIKDVVGKKYEVILNRGIVKIIDIKEKLIMRFATSAELAKAYMAYDAGKPINFVTGELYELLPVPGWNRVGTKKKPAVRSGAPPAKKKALPKRHIIGAHNVALLKDHPFFQAHIRPEDR